MITLREWSILENNMQSKTFDKSINQSSRLKASIDRNNIKKSKLVDKIEVDLLTSL
jgi:hypothetical protein